VVAAHGAPLGAAGLIKLGEPRRRSAPREPEAQLAARAFERGELRRQIQRRWLHRRNPERAERITLTRPAAASTAPASAMMWPRWTRPDRRWAGSSLAEPSCGPG